MCCGAQSMFGEFCGCGCAIRSEYKPRFTTRKQKIAKLEQYLSGLQEEAEAVKEHLAKMKQEK